MRKLELIKALLGLEQAHAAIVEDRHRVSVVVFESPVDRRLAIDGWLFYRVLSPTPALVPPPLEPFRSFPEVSRSGDEILLLLINIIILS